LCHIIVLDASAQTEDKSDNRKGSAVFSKYKKVPERIVTQNAVGEGVLVILMPGGKVPERRSGLHPSEKGLP
jgi:hypothetical protein